MGNSADAEAWSVFAMASGSRSGMSLNNSGFQRVNVVLPEPFAPAIKDNLGRVTATGMRTSSGARREFSVSAFSRWRRPRERLEPSFAPSPSGSQPCLTNTPTLDLGDNLSTHQINYLSDEYI